MVIQIEAIGEHDVFAEYTFNFQILNTQDSNIALEFGTIIVNMIKLIFILTVNNVCSSSFTIADLEQLNKLGIVITLQLEQSDKISLHLFILRRYNDLLLIIDQYHLDYFNFLCILLGLMEVTHINEFVFLIQTCILFKQLYYRSTIGANYKVAILHHDYTRDGLFRNVDLPQLHGVNIQKVE